MKYIYFALLFLVTVTGACGQRQYNCYQKFLKEGRHFRLNIKRNPNSYKLALQKFNSARRCDPSKSDSINLEINNLFKDVLLIMKESKINENKARENLKRAIDATQMLRVSLWEEGKSVLKAQRMQKIADSTKNILDIELKKKQRIIDAFYFYNGRFALAVKKANNNSDDNKYGFINKDGDTLIDYKYDEATPFDSYYGFSRVKYNNKKKLLDTLKNEYLLAQDKSEITNQITAIDFHDKHLDTIPLNSFMLPEVKILLLYNNHLKRVSPQVKELINLQKLYLSYNDSLSSIPEEIGQLKNLLRLYLSKTSIRELPKEIGSLHHLQGLYLGYNDRLTSLPEQIGDLNELLTLHLSHTPIKKLPNHIGDLKKLQRLDLSVTSIDTLPSQIGGLSNLLFLNLSGNIYLKKLPLQIGQLTKLQSLNLINCSSLNDLPEQIKELKELKELNLKGTSLSSETLSNLRKWLPKCIIYDK